MVSMSLQHLPSAYSGGCISSRPELNRVVIAVGSNDNVVLSFTATQDLAQSSIRVTMGGTTVPASRIVPSPAGSKRSFTATQPASLLDNGRVKFEIRYSNLAGTAGNPVDDTTDGSKVVSGNWKAVVILSSSCQLTGMINFCFVLDRFVGAVPKGPKTPGRQDSISFTGPAGVAFGLVVSVAAAIGVALIVLGVVFHRQRRQMRALQRVIDSGAAALDQGAHSASSIDMAVFNTSSSGGEVSSTTASADPDLALHRTAALYESLPISNSPA